jgi:hypothetical protein
LTVTLSDIDQLFDPKPDPPVAGTKHLDRWGFPKPSVCDSFSWGGMDYVSTIAISA